MSSDDPKLSLEDELARAQGVERDLLSQILLSRRRAWQVAAASVFTTICATVAVAAITPLKEPPELYVVRVNDATGEIKYVSRLADAKENYGDRLTRTFINEFVLACESYDWYTIQNTHDRCALYSAPSVQKEYGKKFQGEQALQKTYAQHTRVRVDVRSITLGPKQSANVRFSRRTENNMGQVTKEENLIATLAYDYVNADLTEDAGRINPIGFQVLSYDTDVEVAFR
ncbi:type IV secretion system protein [Pusillimonas caeni]|uniref:virB8 family protein n=1 Tax=Pusillimonas caeni TaxID=1348472 RepID=UPI000E59B947|nr:type IV secretion system protein [Pusillimonas caeni]TFL14070.1 type IV secretion system protein [Pusillimonas caeni]